MDMSGTTVKQVKKRYLFSSRPCSLMFFSSLAKITATSAFDKHVSPSNSFPKLRSDASSVAISVIARGRPLAGTTRIREEEDEPGTRFEKKKGGGGGEKM